MAKTIEEFPLSLTYDRPGSTINKSQLSNIHSPVNPNGLLSPPNQSLANQQNLRNNFFKLRKQRIISRRFNNTI
jgi:hypothetical protein